jgi:transketolase
MRSAFIGTLVEIARQKQNIFLLVGDLGYNVVEPFAREFPDRFINTGIAEQNMTGVAAGLALCGKIVFTYSIANFPTLRCLEQIRNDICYHNANVKIVSVGGGLTYGSLGITHLGIDDLAAMRALPKMTIVVPGDLFEAAEATRAITEINGPCYLRLTKPDGELNAKSHIFKIGRAVKLREGRDITLIANGGMLYTAYLAAEQLSKAGVEARVLSMHTLKPLDAEAICVSAQETEGIITIEEHNIIGGLGSAVAEILAEVGIAGGRFKRMGINDSFPTQTGSQDYLRNIYCLSTQGIFNAAMTMLRKI